MNIIGLAELQVNPNKFSHLLLSQKYLLITDHDKPLSLALPFDLPLLENGMKNWIGIKAFQSGDLSLGQLSKILSKNKRDTLSLLGNLNIPFADYDLEEDLAVLDELFSA